MRTSQFRPNYSNLLFSEEFFNVKTVNDNKGVVTSGVVINKGAVLLGTAYTHSINFGKQNLFNQSGISIRWKGKIDYSDSDNYAQCFSVSTSTPWGKLLASVMRSGSSNNLLINFANGLSYINKTFSSIPDNEIVDLIGTYDGTIIKLYYNGAYESGTTIGAFGDIDFGALQGDVLVGRASTGQYKAAETVEICQLYNKALTAEEIKDIYEFDTYKELEHPVIELPLRTWYYDNSNEAKTENKGSLKDTAVVGDGNTPATFPTFLNPHGITTSASTYIKKNLVEALGKDFSIVFFIKTNSLSVATRILFNIGDYTTDGMRLIQTGEDLKFYWNNAVADITITGAIPCKCHTTIIVSSIGGIITSFIDGELKDTTDLSAKSELSGNLDVLISHTSVGFIGNIFDHKLYNFGITPLQARKLNNEMFKRINV